MSAWTIKNRAYSLASHQKGAQCFQAGKCISPACPLFSVKLQHSREG